MLVASWARTGATKIAMDLAESLGIPYIGELAPTYMHNIGGGKPHIKNEIHELKTQRIYSDRQFFNALIDTRDTVYLVNKAAYFVADRAQCIVLRHNVHASMLSFCNVIARLKYPSIESILLYAMLMFEEAYGLATWCDFSPVADTNIIWFEDQFPNHVQNIDALTPEHRLICDSQIDSWIRSSDITDKIRRIYAVSH